MKTMHGLLVAFACALAAGAVSSAERAGSETVDVLCIYYPEWHVYPEGEKIFGAGRSEWDFVDSAKPRFAGHEQPVRLEAGHPDDADPADVAKEIDLAAGAGIDAFVYDWYWADGRPIQHEALERGYLKAANRSRVKFAIMWANHDRTDVFRSAIGANRDRLFWRLDWTKDEFLAALDYCIAHYFARPEYYRRDGRPFFSVYSARRLMEKVGGPAAMKAVLAEARARARAAGLPPIHFSAMNVGRTGLEDLAAAGYETVSSYNINPCSFDENERQASRTGVGQTFGYDAFVDLHGRVNAENAKASPLPYLPVVTRGWDCTPRCRQDEPFPWRKMQYPYIEVVTGATPASFGRMVAAALEQAWADPKRPGAILINAWNEYTEGCYLMPDKRHGDAFLRALAKETGGKF